jgi:hypothetical protein
VSEDDERKGLTSPKLTTLIKIDDLQKKKTPSFSV